VKNKIYCLGLSRTGTTSLSDFLKEYGLNVIHYPTPMQLMGGAGDGASDIPVVPVYKDLDKMFRGSKFIHLVRDNWTDAVEPYFMRKYNRPHQGGWQLEIRQKVYGDVFWNRAKYNDAYNRHNDDVADYFSSRPDDLITLNVVGGDDPEKIIKFLGLKSKGVSFPKSNSREKTWSNSQDTKLTKSI